MSDIRLVKPKSAGPQAERSSRLKELGETIKNMEPTGGTINVGQASTDPGVTAPEVAAIRYVATIILTFVLTVVGGIKMSWSLPFVFIVFALMSLLSVWVLTLLETGQLQGIINAVADYNLNYLKVERDGDTRDAYIEAVQFLDFYELRHRLTMERQQFLLDNQMRIAEFLKEAGGAGQLAEQLVREVLPNPEPGALVDTIFEDQIAETLGGYFVSLFDVNSRGEWTKMDQDGVILENVPWAEDGTMVDEDRDVVIGIFNRIASRTSALVTQTEEGKWKLNLAVYDRPIEVLKAFDMVYH